MWDSKESVYKIIKPPQTFRLKTPPTTAKELRDRKVAKITLKLKLMMKQKLAATFGRPVGSFRTCPRNYLKKHSKEPVIVYGQQRCTKNVKRKPDVPRDKPVYGRVKILDFIKMNADQMIHSRPNKSRCPKKMRNYTLKKSFGKLPAYLSTKMRNAAAQKKKDSPEEQAKAKAACHHAGTRKLDEKERITMMNNLKLKWADTNARYQALSVVLDMESKKRRKERYEANLTLLEKDVSLLSRKVILVSDSAPSKVDKALPP